MKTYLAILALSILLNSTVKAVPDAGRPVNKPDALAFLAAAQDRYHSSFYVYYDANAAGNHFTLRGKTGDVRNGAPFPSMKEDCLEKPYSGATCIKAESGLQGKDWGGWYFLNGVLEGGETGPKENWGDDPNAGVDLSGAAELTFRAKGALGGERVEFFAFGVGRSGGKPFPDSSPTVSTGYVSLADEWKQYRIDLKGKTLNYITGGFGWITNAVENHDQPIVFYIDDIRYNKARSGEPRFLVSYETSAENDFDRINGNAAFTYDNALAAIAFLAAGKKDRARVIVDALVYAMAHDRYYRDGRIRNAYQGGDLISPPGWRPNGKSGTVRMPYWRDEPGKWREDGFHASTHTGNAAWAILALITYYDVCGGGKYLAASERMGEWIETNCRDSKGGGGYTGGFEGWEPSPVRLTYKSTEHNIDVYAAFYRLYLITRHEKWLERANHAQTFVLSMWDPSEGKFWTGTRNDGITINTDIIPTDIQIWSLLNLNDRAKTGRALRYAEAHQKAGTGFDFNTDLDGIWYEGTAQAAVAYRFNDEIHKSNLAVQAVKDAQFSNGGVPAADKDGLTTGLTLSGGQPWLYYHRAHVGATAWLYFAENGINPFSYGVRQRNPPR